ncbi:MAG: hypothetical protein V3R25_09215 [Nitrosomonadaceae bacterium]
MAVLNSNNAGAVGALIALTTQTKLTLYVLPATGTHANHQLGIEISPDGGTSWLELPNVVRGLGEFTREVVATQARVKVIQREGATSTVNAFLLAR